MLRSIFSDTNGGNDSTPRENARSVAAELLRLVPEVIISTTSTTTRAVLDEASNIPIVAAVSGDPVASDLQKVRLTRPAMWRALRLSTIHSLPKGLKDYVTRYRQWTPQH
jgi:hypothetical protein